VKVVEMKPAGETGLRKAGEAGETEESQATVVTAYKDAWA